MKFLVDAQLPRRLSLWLGEQGYDAKHTLELLLGNRTPDADLIAIADREDRVLVTKDDDFVQSFFVSGRPRRLLLVATGNITNKDLLAIWQKHIGLIENAFMTAQFVEFSKGEILMHQ
jgi:predicted nuclease of predicted toxin-antitoxin system